MGRPKKENTVARPDQTTQAITPIAPALPIERVYRLAKEGNYGNLRVEEISIQGDQVIGRHYVSERDAKPFALARLMGLVEDQVRRDYK